jgi:hypothetical protein
MLRMLGLAALICAAQLDAQSPTGTIDGWALTVRTTTDSGSLDHKHWLTRKMRIAGHFVRTEVPDGPIPPAPLGMGTPTMISDDSAHTTTMLMANMRRAMVTPIGSTVHLNVPNDSTSRFIVAPAMSMRDLGAAEPILGHPTHKYSISTSYVAQTTMLGSPCRKTVNDIETIWVATDLQREEQLRKYVRDSRPATNAELGPVGDSVTRMNLHRERLVNGMILRDEVVLTKPSAAGPPVKVTYTTEVLELSHGPIPRSMFAVPADYQMMPRPPQRPVDSAALKARRAAIDSSVRERMYALVCDPAPVK